MRLVLHTDGGSRGNPGPAAAGVVIHNAAGEQLFGGGFFLGKHTNNEAEYEGIIRALELARQLGGTAIELYSDSELLVKQIQGRYRVRNERLKPLYDRVKHLVEQFSSFSIEHVYREKNANADALVNQALDAGHDVGGIVGEKDNTPVQKTARKEPPTGGAVRVVTDLRERIVFDKTGPHQEKLWHEQQVASDLVCLEAGQEFSLAADDCRIVMAVMRGKGTVRTPTAKHAVRAGFWLHIEPVNRLQLLAHSREAFVCIITIIRSISS